MCTRAVILRIKKIFRFDEISNLFVKYCLAYLAESQWQILMDYLIRIGQNKLIWSLLIWSSPPTEQTNRQQRPLRWTSSFFFLSSVKQGSVLCRYQKTFKESHLFSRSLNYFFEWTELPLKAFILDETLIESCFYLWNTTLGHSMSSGLISAKTFLFVFYPLHILILGGIIHMLWESC